MSDTDELPGRDWVEQEILVRDHARGPGLISLDELRRRDGLEVLQQVTAGTLPYPPICETLGFMLLDAQGGHVVFQGIPEVRHCGPLATVHDAFAAALLQS